MKSPLSRLIFLASLLLFSATAPRALTAQQTGQQTGQQTAQSTASDPFIWLEDVDSKRSMDWVNAKNAATVAVLGATPPYQAIYDRTKAILDSKDRIPYPRIVGDMLYNFWQDADEFFDHACLSSIERADYALCPSDVIRRNE